MARKRITLMADFETTVDPEDCRVWAGCAVDIDSMEVTYLGTELDEFMEYLQDKNSVCYFHNLKFDGEFILYWLFTHGYRYSDSRKDKTFTTLITDDGLFYSIEVIFHRGKSKRYDKVVFYDSLKKLPFKVATIAKAFELPMAKGSIDYKAHRPKGYQLTEKEKEYIITDCKIVAEALKIQMEQGLKRMTNASDALNGYKSIVGKEWFRRYFPELPVELDKDIRRAYKGGFTHLMARFKNAMGLQGKQFDVNSLYSWVMYTKLLPYGYPKYFEGFPDPDENYPLYIIHLKCTFELKTGHIPTIQIKNGYRFKPTEYLTTSRVKMGKHWDDEPVEMWLTNVDYELMMEHYDVEFFAFDDGHYYDGYRFKGMVGLFKEYIDYWMHIKETTTGSLRQLAKLMLNSLYGKFATNPRAVKKIPYLDNETGTVHYKIDEPEEREPVYTAMGCFITAYAREKTIRSAQANYDRFIYADTDSLKLLGYEDPVGLDIHDTHLGAWKDEGDFINSKWVRAKTYMVTVQQYTKKRSLKAYGLAMNKADSLDVIHLEADGIHYLQTKVTCAGMPDNVKEQVTYANFCPGSVFDGKLVPRRYPGGIILEDTTFTIM